jgi:hypothetical protein
MQFKKMPYPFMVILFTCLVVIGCMLFVTGKRKVQYSVYAKSLSLFLTDPELQPASSLCRIINDTLYANLPYTYNEAMENLHGKFKEIDKLEMTPPEARYAKALLCADLVYAAFSYRLLGDSLGIDNDSILLWQKLSMQQAYELGTHNYLAVYCGDRTAFFCNLVDSLLQLETKVVDIKDRHTFPLIKINDGWYIIDPYDPFAVIDSVNGMLLSYEEIEQKNFENLIIKRTRRTYGSSRELISRPLLYLKSKSYEPCDIASYITQLKRDYISRNPSGDVSLLHLPDFSQIRPVANNTRFSYALPLNERPDGRLYYPRDLKKYYYSDTQHP